MMRFETKTFNTLGNPRFLKGINPLESNLLDISKGLTVLISLVAIGVPVGYIMHQIYLGLAWVLNNKGRVRKMRIYNDKHFDTSLMRHYIA